MLPWYLSGLHGPYELKDLRFIRNGSKRAANHALTAGYTYFTVNAGPAEPVALNGINPADRLAGPFLMTDSIVRTYLFAFPAANTSLDRG